MPRRRDGGGLSCYRSNQDKVSYQLDINFAGSGAGVFEADFVTVFGQIVLQAIRPLDDGEVSRVRPDFVKVKGFCLPTRLQTIQVDVNEGRDVVVSSFERVLGNDDIGRGGQAGDAKVFPQPLGESGFPGGQFAEKTEGGSLF